MRLLTGLLTIFVLSWLPGCALFEPMLDSEVQDEAKENSAETTLSVTGAPAAEPRQTSLHDTTTLHASTAEISRNNGILPDREERNRNASDGIGISSEGLDDFGGSGLQAGPPRD